MADSTEHRAARTRRKSETRNFCIRLTDDEKRLLTEKAGRVPLGAYIRNALLEAPGRRRSARAPMADDTALARVLAALGQSRLSSNLNQLAKAIHMGVLPVTPETEADITEACAAIIAMRHDLLLALGLSGAVRP